MNNNPKAPFQKGDDVEVSHDGKVWQNGRYLCSSPSRYYAYTYDYDGGPDPTSIVGMRLKER